MTDRKGMKSGVQTPGRCCVHVENGRAGIPKICIHDYACGHCAFDQWIEEMEERAFSREDLSTEKDFLASFHPQMALFCNLCVNQRDFLCDVPYARLRAIP